ncbi:MAG: acyclic terpene utilization AtuA family protein [Rhodobacteraceae bacterium]|nr:acyclic terpene utilization AtuA family protein [Paracoccaceae bacterium]
MTRVLVPGGVLGLGFDTRALQHGIAARPDIIAIDGGSTDSGPNALGTGVSKYSRAVTRSEWAELMAARSRAGVPLIIGSAGTAGTDAGVDWMLDITREIARERNEHLRIAAIYSQVTPETVLAALDDGRITPLDPAPSCTPEIIRSCTHIVAVQGTEPFMAALESGADIIIAGRATDTATIAALPLMRGNNPGACWHGAKIGECGALCSTEPLSGCILIEFDADGFTVWPTAPTARCTAQSVHAHMLYENADPHRLHEPGGTLDVTNAAYNDIADGAVRVTNSRWIPTDPYRVKLEGAAPAGARTLILALIRDRHYVRNAETWKDHLLAHLHATIRDRTTFDPASYTIEIRLIGINATLGNLENCHSEPTEVGALCIVNAPTQPIATEIAKLCNPFLLHFPLQGCTEMPSFAFPFSPAELDCGPQYAFSLNHLMTLSDPMDTSRMVLVET